MMARQFGRFAALWLAALLLALPWPAGAQRLVRLDSMRVPVVGASWADLRDRQVVKQQHDFSCGAASLATILRHYYRLDVDEAAVLEHLHDYAASFQDLAQAARQGYGLRAQGLSANFASLQKLKIPVIVFLDIGAFGHFAVLRGIDAQGQVWLADPSRGNQLYSQHQFLRMWDTETGGEGRGKILAILPPRSGGVGAPEPAFFVSEGLEDTLRP